MVDLPEFSDAKAADPWAAFLATLRPDDRQWMVELREYSERSGEPREITMAKAAVDRHEVGADLKEQLGWQSNTIARLAKKLRDAGLSAA